MNPAFLRIRLKSNFQRKVSAKGRGWSMKSARANPPAVTSPATGFFSFSKTFIAIAAPRLCPTMTVFASNFAFAST